MPTTSRKTSADVVVHQTSPLCRLPSNLLHDILFGSISAHHLTLCKQLLPNTHEAVLYKVDIFSAKHLAQFACSIKVQPKNAHLVRHFGFSDASRLSDEDGPERWTPVREKAGSGQLAPSNVALEAMHVRSYRPEAVTVGFGLLKDLLRLLSNLESLAITGTPLMPPLFAPTFLNTYPYPRLKNLSLAAVVVSERRMEDWDAVPLFSLCHDLRLIRSLENIVFAYNSGAFPLDRLNLAPTVALQPRSWHLRHVQLEDFSRIGPETAVLFSALTDSLHCLGSRHSRLEELTISLGEDCLPSGYRVWILPSVGSSIEHLTRLRHLHLVGHIVGPETFEAIAKLPSLICLTLGEHTALSLSPLLKIVQRVAPSQPKLRALQISICRCKEPGRSKRYPHWPYGFTFSDARKLVAAIHEAGIEYSGSLACAVGDCSTKPLHVCPDWIVPSEGLA